MIISIDVGMRTFTGVAMEGNVIKGICTRDLQVSGKDLPAITRELLQVCRQLNDYKPTLVLVEKQLGKFSFAQVESAVYMYFELVGVPVVQMNPRYKLQARVQNVQMPKSKESFSKKYDFNKYMAKQMFDTFLINTQQTVQFPAKLKKDVADAVLQCIYYQQQHQVTTD